ESDVALAAGPSPESVAAVTNNNNRLANLANSVDANNPASPPTGGARTVNGAGIAAVPFAPEDPRANTEHH
ncbi:hypothetical protein HK102_010865, partial [Quaeritorhiza haematococci]